MVTHHIPNKRAQESWSLPAPPSDNQTAAPSYGRSGLATSLPQRWIRWLLSLSGILLPLGAGILVNWPWERGEIFALAWVFASVVVGMVLSEIIGACLLRSQWALVLTPVVWALGEFLGAVLLPLFQGGWSMLRAEQQFWEVQETILALAFSPLVLCAALGAGGKVREIRQRFATGHIHAPISHGAGSS